MIGLCLKHSSGTRPETNSHLLRRIRLNPGGLHCLLRSDEVGATKIPHERTRHRVSAAEVERDRHADEGDADDLEEMKTVCACGRKASMNVRLGADGTRVTDGEQALIGGNDCYRAVCPRCFYSEAEDAAKAPGLFG